MDINSLYIFLLSIGGAFILRTTGFGFGIFIMTMLPYLMPSYGECTALSGLLAMSSSVFVVWRMRKYLHWSRLMYILPTFAIISVLSIFVLKRMDDVLLRKILGVALVLISVYFTFFSQRIKMPTTRPWQMGAGGLSGLMGGFFSMQGPPAVLYFISSSKDKNEYMAQVQTYLLTGNIIMTAARAYNGFITEAVGWAYVYGIGGVALGTIIGNYVFKHIPSRIFRYVVYSWIAVSGIIIFLSVD